MRKKVATTLFFLTSLFVTSGQNKLLDIQDQKVNTQKQIASLVLIPEISQYGSLVGLKDATGKNLLKEITHRWKEGFAIAYQVKDSKGVYKDGLVYVMGNSTSRLKVEGQKSTTSRKVVTTIDKALEIGRVITWDEKSRSLKSQITIKNISNYELRLKAIEIDIDKRVASLLVAQRDLEFLNESETQPQCPDPIQATMGCYLDGADCPQCLCDPRCQPGPGQAKAFVREPLNREPVHNPDPTDPLRNRMPPLKVPTLCLLWAGSNLSMSTLKPGEQIAGHYTFIIPQ